MKGGIVPLQYKCALPRNTGPELLSVKADTVINTGPSQAPGMYRPPSHSPRPVLLALSAYILARSSSPMTSSQEMLNRPSVKGDRPVWTTYLPVSILRGKLAVELKSAHLFSP